MGTCWPLYTVEQYRDYQRRKLSICIVFSTIEITSNLFQVWMKKDICLHYALKPRLNTKQCFVLVQDARELQFVLKLSNRRVYKLNVKQQRQYICLSPTIFYCYSSGFRQTWTINSLLPSFNYWILLLLCTSNIHRVKYRPCSMCINCISQSWILITL